MIKVALLVNNLPTVSEARKLIIVVHLIKARNLKPEDQPLLGDGCVTRNTEVIVGSGVFCAVPFEAV